MQFILGMKKNVTFMMKIIFIFLKELLKKHKLKKKYLKG